jgi:hypothetical protein
VVINPHFGSFDRGVSFSNDKMFWCLLSGAGILKEQETSFVMMKPSTSLGSSSGIFPCAVKATLGPNKHESLFDREEELRRVPV